MPARHEVTGKRADYDPQAVSEIAMRHSSEPTSGLNRVVYRLSAVARLPKENKETSVRRAGVTTRGHSVKGEQDGARRT